MSFHRLPLFAKLIASVAATLILLAGPLSAANANPVSTRGDALTSSPVTRIGGADRYSVSAAVSAATFDPGITAVFIASGEVFPDALTASSAGAAGWPVLLVTRDTIPDAIAAELRRLAPEEIFVIGGPDTLSESLSADLRGYAPVLRIGGSDRYAVSAHLSQVSYGGIVRVAYIASGEIFPDALSGSAAAGLHTAPLLLVQRDGVPEPIAAELERLRPKKIVVLGGTNSVSESTRAALSAYAPSGSAVQRISGADRCAVSASVSADTFPSGSKTAYVASGTVFADALSGSAAAIVDGAPILLVTKDGIGDAVRSELTRLKPSRIVVLGGTDSVSDDVARQLSDFIVV